MRTDVKKTIEFDTRIYRMQAVKKAAYKFGDRLHFHIEACDANGDEVQKLRVTISLRQKSDLDYLAGEYCSEVLDQELREVVAEETRPVRDVLLAQAFSAISLLDKDGDEGDYRQDPKGIRLHGGATSSEGA